MSKPAVADQRLFRLTWPILIEMSLMYLISLGDMWFLSRVSDTAAAAVGAIMPIIAICQMFFAVLRIAGGSVSTQRLGAGDLDKVDETFSVTFLLCLGLGVMFGLIYIFFSGWMVGAMGIEGEMAAISTTYLMIVGGGMSIQGIRIASSVVFSSHGLTQISMWIAVGMNLVNLGGNLVLAEWMGWGVSGVAIASLIAWLFSFLVSVFWIQKKLNVRYPCFRCPRFWPLAKPILKIAGPSICDPIAFQVSMLAFSMMVVRMGETAMAARIYSMNLSFMCLLWLASLSTGMQIKLGHLIGARRFADADRALNKTILVGGSGAIVMMLSLWLGASVVFRIFTDDPAILELCGKVMLIGVLVEMGRTLNMIAGGGLRCSGDARFNAVVSVSLIALVAIPAGWLLGLHFGLGLIGIWWAQAIDEITRGLVCLARWKTGRWTEKGVYASEG